MQLKLSNLFKREKKDAIDEAVKAVRKWEYEPAKFNGQGVAVWTNISNCFWKIKNVL